VRVSFNASSVVSIYAALEKFRRAAEADAAGRTLPPMERSGIRYERERRGNLQPEKWQIPTTLLRSKRGDCEDIAMYEAVRLSQAGIRATVILQPQGAGLFHAVVQLPNGKIYDPCLGVGMGD
jgi:hypothetical protein